MINIHTSALIRTSAEIRSFRSLKNPVRPHQQALDAGRVLHGRGQRVARAHAKAWHASQGR
ncbi:hypothetical protein [uncultured Thiodictyon sp.]|uniref:hypothetical protein n=1 Tax=uncultured Thiodictyon sp. TaxID=1846217 RepID=UPI0025EDF1F0|nr:hypothetical protein [uncultured Thiodictyon sp.]